MNKSISRIQQQLDQLFEFLKTKDRKGNKKYNVPHSFKHDFIDLIEKLYKELGEEVFQIQGIANKHMDIVQFTNDFFANSAVAVADKTVDPNANNFDRSVLQYNYSNNKALMRLNSLYILWYAIEKLYDKQSADKSIRNILCGKVFVNDLHSILQPYCWAFDLDTLVREGMTFFSGNMKIGAPKRSSSFIALVIQATAYISNQITGAIAYPTFFLHLNYYYEKEFGKHYMKYMTRSPNIQKEVLNQFQNLIYSLNFPFRGSESSFTNLSVLDAGFIRSLFGQYVFPDGSVVDNNMTANTVALAQMFFEYFTHINGSEGMFTFPVMTLACSKTEDGVDEDFINWIAEANREKCLGNIFVDAPTSFSSCCRLRNSFSDIGFQNSFGVGGSSIGSLRVAGVNLASVSSPDDLNERLECVHKILYAHRQIIERQIRRGFLPLYTHHWMNLKKQYSTVGFVGGYEYAQKFGIVPERDAEEYGRLMSNLLGEIEKKTELWQSTDKSAIYNIEQIPAESVAVRLAKIDKVLGHNTSGTDLYANQYIPLTADANIYTRLSIQGVLDQKTSGGAIAHINIKDNEPLPKDAYKRLIHKAIELGVKYWAVNLAFKKCKNNHYTTGKGETCDFCGAEITDTFSRVVGFITNTKNWHKVRREEEFPNRKFYENGSVE